MKILCFNKKYIHDEYCVSVNFFDTIKGLSKETTELVNAKIEEIKARSEYPMSKLIKTNEELTLKIYKYR